MIKSRASDIIAHHNQPFKKKKKCATAHMLDGHWEGQACIDQRKIYAYHEKRNRNESSTVCGSRDPHI